MSKKHRGKWMQVPKGNQPHFGPDKVPEDSPPAEEQTSANAPPPRESRRTTGSPPLGGARKK